MVGFCICRAHQKLLQTSSFSRLARLTVVCHQTKNCSSRDHYSTDSITIPKRIKKDDLAVLRALSKTVGKDSTALPYMYHDDPYLLPKSAAERRRYALSKESGRKAAQFVVNTKPELFLAMQKDEPKIEAFYPPVHKSAFNEPCEEAILERIAQNDMQGAIEMHTKLKETGHQISSETNNTLLDFLCFHGCYSASGESPGALLSSSQAAEEEGEGEEKNESDIPAQGTPPPRKWNNRRNKLTWKDGNPADVLFSSMEEKDAHSYNSMIRGLVKFGAYARAFTLYNEMQERGIQADVHAYNSLIEGSIEIRDDYRERWTVMAQLMRQMELEKVHPNLQTFNTLLDNLRIMGAVGRKRALQTISEMKAIGVEPSLGTYSILLTIFYKDSLPPNDMLYDIMDTVEAQEFTLRHPQDVSFFKNAMTVCLSLRDVQLAYRVDMLLNTGENYKLAGDYTAQNIYYGKFFHLICLMDIAEAMFDYYDKFVPSALIPSTIVYMDMMRSLETACAYDHIPQIWNDICVYGHRYRQNVLEMLIQIMATSTDASDENKSDFCAIVLDVMAATRESKSRIDPIQFGSVTLDYMVSICLQANELDAAWEALQIIKKDQKVPSSSVMEDFLQGCINSQDTNKVLECLRMAVGSNMTVALGLADRIKSELTLNQKQRDLLEDIVMDEDITLGQGSTL